jgi:hypothetical protein
MDMRKSASWVLIAVVVLLALAVPAAAQVRDPFDPIVGEEEETTGGATETQPATQGGETEVRPQPVTEVSPNTGGDPSPFLIVAYGLLAVGVGAIVLSKTLGPQAVRSSR